MSMGDEDMTVAQCLANSRVQYFHISIVRSVEAYITTHSVLPSFPRPKQAVFIAQRTCCHGLDFRLVRQACARILTSG